MPSAGRTAAALAGRGFDRERTMPLGPTMRKPRDSALSVEFTSGHSPLNWQTRSSLACLFVFVAGIDRVNSASSGVAGVAVGGSEGREAATIGAGIVGRSSEVEQPAAAIKTRRIHTRIAGHYHIEKYARNYAATFADIHISRSIAATSPSCRWGFV